MDLQIKDKLFIVCGASSGLGRAVAERLVLEGAKVIGIARREDLLHKLRDKFPGKVITLVADITRLETADRILDMVGDREVDGIFVNSGGPPAMSIAETRIDDWDEAYRSLLRWKVNIVKSLLPKFISQGYGRILFSESSTIKQPVENLVLSNSLRLAVTGFSKSLSEEYANKGIGSNVIGPGFHDTDAVDRLFKKKSENLNISFEDAKISTINKINVGRMGDPMEFASLATWILSPLSSFVTGQVYCLDGGAVKSTL